MFGQSTKQNLISTGNDTFDKFLGGGLLNSTVNLFERQGISSRILDPILNKSISCTTLSKKNNLLFVNFNTSKEVTSEEVLNGLPVNRQVKSEVLYKDVRGSSATAKIKIAWRYTQRGTSSPSDALHKLNQVDFGLSLKREVEPQDLGTLDVLNVKPDESTMSISSRLEKAISQLKATGTTVNVIIKDLVNTFSPLLDNWHELMRMLYIFRGLARSLGDGAIVLCCDSEMLPEKQAVKQQMYNLVDSVISFYGYETDENKTTGYKDIDGTVNYLKVPKLNSYGFHFQQDVSDWGYRLTKNHRYFVVDELCLPPCEDETTDNLPCGSGPKATELRKIDNTSKPLERANPLEEFRQVAKDILPRRLF